MIAKVIFWSNGMVMVFDERGQQLPDYQGRKWEHLVSILRDAPPACQFQEGNWNEGWIKDIERPKGVHQ